MSDDSQPFDAWVVNVELELENQWMHKSDHAKSECSKHISSLLAAFDVGVSHTQASWAIHRSFPLDQIKAKI